MVCSIQSFLVMANTSSFHVCKIQMTNFSRQNYRKCVEWKISSLNPIVNLNFFFMLNSPWDLTDVCRKCLQYSYTFMQKWPTHEQYAICSAC